MHFTPKTGEKAFLARTYVYAHLLKRLNGVRIYGINKISERSERYKLFSIHTHVRPSFERFSRRSGYIGLNKIEWSERSERNDVRVKIRHVCIK